jgi:rhodanese-related sulfurtransferase
MLALDAHSLREMMDSGEDFLLIDVREAYEREEFNIGGLHIPMSIVADHAADFPSGKKLIFYCEKGIRSVIVIQRLQQKFPDLQMYNLSGGMQAWKKSMA